MKELPRLSTELIDKLDKEIPKEMPTPEVNRDKSMFNSGRRDIVDYLINLKEKQQERDMEGDKNV